MYPPIRSRLQAISALMMGWMICRLLTSLRMLPIFNVSKMANQFQSILSILHQKILIFLSLLLWLLRHKISLFVASILPLVMPSQMMTSTVVSMLLTSSPIPVLRICIVHSVLLAMPFEAPMSSPSMIIPFSTNKTPLLYFKVCVKILRLLFPLPLPKNQSYARILPNVAQSRRTRSLQLVCIRP